MANIMGLGSGGSGGASLNIDFGTTPPSDTSKLWVPLGSKPSAVECNPILNYGMEYTYGLYYLDPEDGKTYLCKHGSETGTIVLQYLPHELVGHYFEEA